MTHAEERGRAWLVKRFERPLFPGEANRPIRVRSRGQSYRMARWMQPRRRWTNSYWASLHPLLAPRTACRDWKVDTNRKEQLPVDRLRVVATDGILGDGGKCVESEQIALATFVGRDTDAHADEPMSPDRVALVEAAVVFAHGLGFERWFDRFYEPSGSAAVRDVVMQMMQPRIGIKAAGELQQAPDVWHALAFAARMVRDHRAAFVEIDTLHADESIRRAADDERELQRPQKEVRTHMEMLPPAHHCLVTTHDTFGNFAGESRALISSILHATSSETSDRHASELAAIMERIREEQVPAIRTEKCLSPRLIEQVAEEPCASSEPRPDASSSSRFCQFLGAALDRLRDTQTIIHWSDSWTRLMSEAQYHRSSRQAVLHPRDPAGLARVGSLHESETGARIVSHTRCLIPSVSFHLMVRSAPPVGVAGTPIGIGLRRANVNTRRKRFARQAAAMALSALNDFPPS